MPKGIKTRSTIRDIKLLDRAGNLASRIKGAVIRSKQTAVETQQSAHDSGEAYATDQVSAQISAKAQDAAQSAVHRMYGSRKGVRQQVGEAGRQMPKTQREVAEQARQTAAHTRQTADVLKGKAQQAQKAAQQAQRAMADAKRTLQQTRQVGRQTIRAAEQGTKTVRTTSKAAKATGKGTVKTVRKSVKTAERTAKVAVKTAQRTAKATQQTARASARAAKMAAQASKAAIRVAIRTTRMTIKAVTAAVKATIAAIKGLVSFIVAGGWVAVLIIIIVCLIALLLGSVFGIFFSNENTGSGMTMQTALADVNAEFQDRLTEIQEITPHDTVEIVGYGVAWKEVMMVYAVQVSAGAIPMEVVTMDATKYRVLREAFWAMTEITYTTEEREVVTMEVITQTGGHTTQVETIEIQTVLIISVDSISAARKAVTERWDEERMSLLAELSSPQYDDMWAEITPLTDE